MRLLVGTFLLLLVEVTRSSDVVAELEVEKLKRDMLLMLSFIEFIEFSV